MPDSMPRQLGPRSRSVVCLDAQTRRHPLQRNWVALFLGLAAFVGGWSSASFGANPIPRIYTAPYNDTDFYTTVSDSTTVEQAELKFWDAYKRYWGVAPYGPLQCGYTPTYFSDGESTGAFARLDLNGQCSGSTTIVGSATCPRGYSLSGSVCVQSGAVVADANRGRTSAQCNGSNPINGATGNKFQQETDYVGAGAFPLRLDRFYNSESSIFGVAGTNYSGNFGLRWSSSYERSIKLVNAVAFARRPDGNVIYFVQSGGNWIGDPGVTLRLSQDGSGWTLTDSQDISERYDTSGRLIWLQNRVGLRQTLTYQAGQMTVTDPFGRALVFTYANGRVATVTDPANQIYAYAYDAVGNLQNVQYPGSVGHTYHYEDSRFPSALTGITDENGHRFASYAYDSQERAVSSEHSNGAGRVSLTFNTNGTVTLIDSLNASRTQGFKDRKSVV